MDFITNNKGVIVLAVDEINLYYLDHEQNELSEMSQEEEEKMFLDELSSSIPIKYLENDSGYKLATILELQSENNLISDHTSILEKLKSLNPTLERIISDYEDSLCFYSTRIVLLEIEGGGPASSYLDKLFLIANGKKFDLYTTQLGYLSAAEKLEYYGLNDEEYWDSLISNGESLEGIVEVITSGEELYKGIINLLSQEDQWNITEEEINWKLILKALIENELTKMLGIELKAILENKSRHST